jgi:hypothetical protein
MPFKEPFHIGPFEVDRSGGISLKEQHEITSFVVSWRGCSVLAKLREGDEGDAHLRLEAALGRIPSTAGEQDTVRSRCFAILRALPGALPDGWQLRLLPDHRMRLETSQTVALPITVTDLVARLTCFLLALDPYLDLLQEAGITRSQPLAA